MSPFTSSDSSRSFLSFKKGRDTVLHRSKNFAVAPRAFSERCPSKLYAKKDLMLIAQARPSTPKKFWASEGGFSLSRKTVTVRISRLAADGRYLRRSFEVGAPHFRLCRNVGAATLLPALSEERAGLCPDFPLSRQGGTAAA